MCLHVHISVCVCDTYIYDSMTLLLYERLTTYMYSVHVNEVYVYVCILCVYVRTYVYKTYMKGMCCIYEITCISDVLMSVLFAHVCVFYVRMYVRMYSEAASVLMNICYLSMCLCVFVCMYVCRYVCMSTRYT